MPHAASQSNGEREFKAIWTELLASLLFLFVCGGVVTSTANVTFGELLPPRLAVIALTQGVAYAAMLYFCVTSARGGIGFMNPATLLAFLLTNHVHGQLKWRGSAIWRVLWLLLAQFTGGVVGSVLVLVTIPNAAKGTARLGAPQLGYGSTFWSAMAFEALCTFFLVWVTLATFVRREGTSRTTSAPLAVGAALTALQLFAYPFTGGAMNPIRALAPFLCTWSFEHWTVYVAGPVVGAVAAALAYVLAFTNEDKLFGLHPKRD